MLQQFHPSTSLMILSLSKGVTTHRISCELIMLGSGAQPLVNIAPEKPPVLANLRRWQFTKTCEFVNCRFWHAQKTGDIRDGENFTAPRRDLTYMWCCYRRCCIIHSESDIGMDLGKLKHKAQSMQICTARLPCFDNTRYFEQPRVHASCHTPLVSKTARRPARTCSACVWRICRIRCS